jgi:hypothetical protein
MAEYGKKKERITMQRAIDDMMNQMGLAQLHFVVTADLATKLSTLMYYILYYIAMGRHRWASQEIVLRQSDEGRTRD